MDVGAMKGKGKKGLLSKGKGKAKGKGKKEKEMEKGTAVTLPKEKSK